MCSKYSPGIIILNNFKFSKEPSFGIMFKVDMQQLIKEAAETKRSHIFQVDMTIVSIMQKYDATDDAHCGRTLDIKFRIRETRDYEKKILQYSLVFNSTDGESEPQSFKDLDSDWHFLFMRTKKAGFGSFKNNALEFYMDSFEKSNKNYFSIEVKDLHTEAEHFVALGNNADTLYRHMNASRNLANMQVRPDKKDTKGKEEIKTSSKEESKTEIQYVTLQEYYREEKKISANFDINNVQYFRGNISLPFFLLKISDMQKTVLADPLLGRAFRDALIEFINKKTVLNHNNTLDL